MADDLQNCYVSDIRNGSIIVDLILGFTESSTYTPTDIETALTDGAPNVDLAAQGLADLVVDLTIGFSVVGK